MTVQGYVGLVTWVVVSFQDDTGDHNKVKACVADYGKEAVESGLLVSREGLNMERWHAEEAKNAARN
eukprot:6817181-Prorocentrum_lima.AAC.1